MSLNFADLLSVEQKQALIEGKIQQLAIEGYQLQINRLALEKLENSADALAAVDTNIQLIVEAITAYQDELSNLQ